MTGTGAAPSVASTAVDATVRERARSLTLRYLLASTAIFLAAGVLGVLLRDSQADLGRLDPNLFYAVMTAHGLGAFVGWAGFACMGLSWWVLASVGFPPRRFGAVMAEATFWLMLVGVNATITFDAIVHNTVWVVGHFHQMALLNIGLVIFGATYAFLPELTGKALYSERLGRLHVWVTFLAGTGFVIPWLIQGLEGAPRRFAILPDRYNALTDAAIPLAFVLALAQVLFVWNIVQTLRGEGGRYPVREPGLASTTAT